MKIGFTILFVLAHCAAMSQSIFNEGTWFKLGVTADGVYKIDRDYLSKTLKIEVNNLDPTTLKIFGKGGGMLPQSTDAFRYSDPPENALFAVGEADGSMDATDYFLFYGQSPHKTYYSSSGELVHEQHLYSDTTYYFLTFGGTKGKRMTTLEPITNAGPLVNTYQDYILHELDQNNLLRSGREWFGEVFGTGTGATELTFNYDLPGIQDSIHIYTELIGASEGDCSFDLFLNNSLLERIEIDSIPTDSNNPLAKYSNRGVRAVSSMKAPIANPSISFKLRFNRAPSALTSKGYLDFFALTFDRALALYGNTTFFRNLSSVSGPVTYQINASQEVQIWDITTPNLPILQPHQRLTNSVQFSDEGGMLKEYVILSGSAMPTPIPYGSVPNQNLKGNTTLDGIILTPAFFKKEADRLAEFHRIHDQLNVRVVTIREVYNEFSSGMQDITALRDYLRYVWNTGGRLKYVTLFGDASFDFKYRESGNTNFVPVYESRDSFHSIFSYSSDDYYGFLEDGEGEWIETRNGDHTLELGIGRLPVKSLTEATDVVDKIIRYATSSNTFGAWRTKVVYIADDGDGGQHMRDVEKLNTQLSESHVEYEVKRLYLDNYDQVEISNNRYESPGMVLAFKEQIKNGAFVMDYLGHGSPTILMQEQVITLQLLDELTNRHRLPLLVTATCDFGKYDDPKVTSGAEYFQLLPDGGAIALITTTRPVYSNTNLKLNQAFHDYLFRRENGVLPRLGDVMRNTKNNSLEGVNNRNFSLLGDPMLRLNYPELFISFESLEAAMDTLSALEKVVLKGKILEADSSLVESFSGIATVTVLDNPQERVTKGQENAPFSYLEQTNTLFRGDVTVDSGKFDVSFLVPKNTSYKYQQGKIIAYAYDKNNETDASGASTNFRLGGTHYPVVDFTPPQLKLFLNDDSFKSGNTVGTSSLLIGKVYDENGINLSTNGFDQGIFLTLNNDTQIAINEFYTSDIDSYQSGTITYPLQNLEPGKYTATIKLRDSYNNAYEAQVEFKVSDQPKIRLYNVLNYPNPVNAYQKTYFTFEHDREGEDLVVNLFIYDAFGSLVSNWEYLAEGSPRKIQDIEWIPVTYGGHPLQNGVYFYRLNVKSTRDGASNEAVERLIIHN